MKVNSKLLNLALKRVSPAVPDNPLIPILKYVLFKDKKIIATDTNITYIEEFNIGLTEPVVLPHKETTNITNTIDSQIEIIEKDSRICIINGRDLYFAGRPEDAALFPSIPELINPIEIAIDEDIIKAIKDLTKLVGKVPGHPLSNICLNIEGGYMEVCSGTGPIFARFRTTISSNITKKVSLQPLIAAALEDFTGAAMQVDHKFVMFKDAVTQVLLLLSETEYPNYKPFFLNPPQTNLTCSKKELLTAITKASVYGLDEADYYIDFSKSPSFCVINLQKKGIPNELQVHFDVTHWVEGTEKISIPLDNLKTIVNMLSTDKVQIAITASDKPVYIFDVNKTFIVAPLSFRAE